REVEIANIRLTAVGKSRRLKLRAKAPGPVDASGAIKEKRKAYFGSRVGFVEVPVYDGSRLASGNEFPGPAILENPSPTLLIYPDRVARVDQYGNIMICAE